jgi:ribonuclease III
MTQIATPEELQEFIGYEFHNPKILDEALTRKASKNDIQCQDDDCMDPLATLGDAVLDAVVIFRLYDEGERDKGKLTEIKNSHVKRERTRAFAKNSNLGRYIHWGKGEEQDEIWDKGTKALDAVTEALIGAIFLDAQKSGENGLKTVQKFLEAKKFFEKRLE